MEGSQWRLLRRFFDAGIFYTSKRVCWPWSLYFPQGYCWCSACCSKGCRGPPLKWPLFLPVVFPVSCVVEPLWPVWRIDLAIRGTSLHMEANFRGTCFDVSWVINLIKYWFLCSADWLGAVLKYCSWVSLTSLLISSQFVRDHWLIFLGVSGSVGYVEMYLRSQCDRPEMTDTSFFYELGVFDIVGV